MKKALVCSAVLVLSSGCLSGGGGGKGLVINDTDSASYALSSASTFEGGTVIQGAIGATTEPSTRISPLSGNMILTPGETQVVFLGVDAPAGDPVVSALVQFGSARRHVEVAASRAGTYEDRASARAGEQAGSGLGSGFGAPVQSDGSATGGTDPGSGVVDTGGGTGGSGGATAGGIGGTTTGMGGTDTGAPVDNGSSAGAPDLGGFGAPNPTEFSGSSTGDPFASDAFGGEGSHAMDFHEIEQVVTVNPMICAGLCDRMIQVPVRMAAKLATGRIGQLVDLLVELDCSAYGRADRCGDSSFDTGGTGLAGSGGFADTAGGSGTGGAAAVGGGGTAPGQGATGCADPAMASTACDAGGCPNAAVDCATACRNLSDICADATCGADCSGMADFTQCSLACDSTANSFLCLNLYFGCAESSLTCADTTSCLIDAGYL